MTTRRSGNPRLMVARFPLHIVGWSQMTIARLAAFLILLLLGSFEALACRVPPRPEQLRNVEADAIILARITAVDGQGSGWSATAQPLGNLMGFVPREELTYGQPDDVI